jgi:hypothetical protein
MRLGIFRINLKAKNKEGGVRRVFCGSESSI